ncbi:hypothetical protein [Paenibacillus spongiae]|uniref:Uncharacterized protein n=1 Tax=Paenibacillus spongiae TaxID=2909671 RepID=A0ABY5S4A5_9BACL|nr:hypothetical protein [Paenibacillus spongiae]UVI27390.1 hypothetical protein L1F29_18120 [Paenibacillus spongiae]
MANFHLHAFERNRYYTGKLLTVRDFQTEQSYLNEKRHLLNRLIHGSGIVYGLQVEPLTASPDNRGLLIRAGVAIDGCGKEIVVSRDYKELTDIRELSGYPAESGANQSLYLLLTYDECSRERIRTKSHAASCCCDACEANKIVEGFTLSISTTAPDPGADFCSTQVIYEDAYVMIERTAPKAVRPGDVFDAVLKLTTKRLVDGSPQYAIVENVPSPLSLIHTDKLEFVLDNGDAQGKQIEKTYTLRALEELDSLTIDGTLTVNGQNKAELAESSMKVLAPNRYEQLRIESYCSQLAASDEKSSILLATLSVNAKDIITQIDEADRTYVYGNPYLSKRLGCDEEHFGKLPLHALTHQAGGNDEIDVDGLGGVLAEGQKINVSYNKGRSKAVASGFTFAGGLAVQKLGNNFVQVSAANEMQVFTGTVVFKDSFRGAVFVSDAIALDLEDPLIYYALVNGSEMIFSDRHEVEIIASYFREEKLLRFRMTDNRATRSEISTIRWWAIPKSQDSGEVDSKLLT